MHIGFCGAPSTGKTTLAKLISEKYKHYVYIPSLSRQYINDNKIKDYLTLDIDQIIDLQYFCLVNHERYINFSENTISDRTPLDYILYMLDQCTKYKIENNLDIIIMEYYNECINLLSKIDYIFYCPAFVIPSISDGIRNIQWAYIMKQDLILRGLLQKFTNVIYINTISIEDRIKEIELYIKGF